MTTTWYDDPEEEIPIHSLTDLFPPMDEAEYESSSPKTPTRSAACRPWRTKAWP